MKPPFFIVGTQRSGTTLLLQMLNAHSRLYVFNEFFHLDRLIAEHVEDPAALTSYLEERLHLQKPYATGEALPEDAFGHLEMAFAAKLDEIEKQRWAIKDPRMTYFCEEFHRRCPEARFVFIIRDARAVVSSYLGRKMNVANVYTGARLWKSEVLRQRAFTDAHPEVSRWLSFESLLRDPDKELREICDFLEEPFEAGMLEFFKKTPDINLHRGNINITRPLQADIADKWRSKLTPRQIGLVDSLADPVLAEHGYEPSGRTVRVSWPEAVFYRIHQEVMTTYWWQQRSGWQGVRKPFTKLLGQRVR